ncbi:VQ motif-containing protein 20-like [Juglans regia]|uniref:VQ motif-containing protein 20-like n=1 Tax=Juglans regia TaxID=51240 RepID=A0A2I4FFD2_JUGRE|nr:VQ motif-containing protein 20-like [Juglans regia]
MLHRKTVSISLIHKHTENGLCCPPPLKLNKDSHIIKKSSPASSSSTTSRTAPQQQQRHGPVIIYTHSPKIIHTHPKDFMSLVQKLTGLSRAEEDEGVVVGRRQCHKSSETGGSNGAASTTTTEEEEDSKSGRILLGNDDTESSSVITEENCSNVIGDGNVSQVNSYFLPPMFEPPLNPYMADIPVFTPNSADFLPYNQPFYGCTDSIFYMPPNNMTKANDF